MTNSTFAETNKVSSFADNLIGAGYIRVSEKNASEEDFIGKNLETGEIEYYKIDTNKALTVNHTQGGSSSGFIPTNIIQPFTIIGNDDRTQVTNTTIYPYTAICYIEITWQDNTTSKGTAFMYWKNIAITAGHAVYDSSKGGYAKSIKVYPGRNGSSSPYDFAYASILWTSVGWADSSNADNDWGVIKLADDIGELTGYFGAKWQSASYDETDVTISGYPIAKSQQQWKASGKIENSTTYRLYYDIDMTSGQSGSPVYNSNYQAIAINSREYTTENSGTRITENMFNFFNTHRT